MKNLSIFIFLLLLTGCQSNILSRNDPTMFGIHEKHFRQLSPDQQQQVIASYNRQQEIRAKNEPMESLVSVLDRSIKQRESRTTVQIRHQTIEQPVRQCRKEGARLTCDDLVQTAHNNTSNYGWEFDKA